MMKARSEKNPSGMRYSLLQKCMSALSSCVLQLEKEEELDERASRLGSRRSLHLLRCSEKTGARRFIDLNDF